MTDDPVDPDIARRLAERHELTRIAAQRVVDMDAEGRKPDPYALEWARGIVSRFKPLGRPVSDGSPAPSTQPTENR
jgi:hypothetical protein